MIITSRLMPGMTVGDGTISIEISGRDGDRAAFRYYIDTPAGELHAGDDIRSATLTGQTPDELIRAGMAALLSFLSAESESYQSTMGERAPADGWSFSAQVAEWAYLNADEISMACEAFGN
ncbi:hypothetical protein [Micromonospora chalcea]|uniref:hypothetical protein n=1 Tax=Micromonospora chalcea TaxID=1874 RepID=UPI003D74BDAD